MFKRSAIILSGLGLASVAVFGQDDAGWKKFGNGDQSYQLNQAQALPPQKSQGAPQNAYPLQNQQQNAYPPAYNVPAQATLSAGTFVVVRVNEKLSSDKNQPGDFFTATLVRPLVANGVVIANAGQNIAGRVSEALNADRGKGTSRLGLELTELSLVDGQQVPIRTQLVEYQRGTSGGRDAGVVVGTTAAGAAIGAVAGGGVGAGIGAIGGAVAGAIGVMATRARATEIHPEAVLTFRTLDPVTIATDRSGGAFQPVQSQTYQSQGQYQAQAQPRVRAVAPPAYYGYGGGYYGGYYGGGYYDPFFYPYYPYGGYYGYGFGPSFGVVVRGGGFRGGRVVVRGGGRRR
jgi:hypothetical protein